MEIIKVILTALLSVASLFIITKVMGHKQVAQLDFSTTSAESLSAP